MPELEHCLAGNVDRFGQVSWNARIAGFPDCVADGLEHGFSLLFRPPSKVAFQ